MRRNKGWENLNEREKKNRKVLGIILGKARKGKFEFEKSQKELLMSSENEPDINF